MSDMVGAAGFLFEAGLLKRSKRTGWWVAGIKDPESVAEHSFRTAIAGMMIASLEGADPTRTAMLCLLHDVPEARIGDIPHIGRRYLTAVAAEDIAADQTAACPEPMAAAIRDAIAEFEAGRTREAVCAKDADKLECLVQAVEYRHGGADTVGPWIENSLAALTTDTARKIAQAALDGNPLDWQQTRRA